MRPAILLPSGQGRVLSSFFGDVKIVSEERVGKALELLHKIQTEWCVALPHNVSEGLVADGDILSDYI